MSTKRIPKKNFVKRCHICGQEGEDVVFASPLTGQYICIKCAKQMKPEMSTS